MFRHPKLFKDVFFAYVLIVIQPLLGDVLVHSLCCNTHVSYIVNAGILTYMAGIMPTIIGIIDTRIVSLITKYIQLAKDLYMVRHQAGKRWFCQLINGPNTKPQHIWC